MTFRQMELFLAVCEHESMNRAASAYFISQQGISKMIRELEDELGCPLLIRSKSGVTPTKSGTYLPGECRAMLEKRNFIAGNLSQMEDLPIETIRLGMAFGMISAMPFGLIQDFEASRPYVRIEYSDHTDYYLERLLKCGEYDFCITSGVLDGDIIDAEKLTQEGIYLCIPRTHRLYQQEHICMEDLRDESFAMFSNQFRIRHKFVDSCQRAGFEPNIIISSSDFNSLKELAINNNLLFTVPTHTENPEDTKIRYYPFPDDAFQWSVYFTKKKSKIMSDGMAAFYRHMKGYLEGQADISYPSGTPRRDTIYFAGGCLWGVQAFVKTLHGVIATEAGRANGTTDTILSPYDGYAECVKTDFDPEKVSVYDLMGYFFECIDPYSLNRQGDDIGEKYRTGVYSENPSHLKSAQKFIDQRADRAKIVVEILPLTNYVPSAPEHQDRLARCPDDYCHLPKALLTKYK